MVCCGVKKTGCLKDSTVTAVTWINFNWQIFLDWSKSWHEKCLLSVTNKHNCRYLCTEQYQFVRKDLHVPNQNHLQWILWLYIIYMVLRSACTRYFKFSSMGTALFLSLKFGHFQKKIEEALEGEGNRTRRICVADECHNHYTNQWLVIALFIFMQSLLK